MKEIYSEAEYFFEGSTLINLLEHRALRLPEQVAYTFLTDGETQEARLSYDELRAQARLIGAHLKERKVSGRHVLLLYPPGLEYISAFFGCLYAGAIAVPAYPPDPARPDRALRRLRAIVKDAQPALVITTHAVLSAAKHAFSVEADFKALEWLATDALAQVADDGLHDSAITGRSLAFLQYTSGSTGSPKGVMLTHGNLLHNAAVVYNALKHTPQDKYLSWLPMFHDMGFMAGILEPLYGGLPVILMSPASFLERPLRWLQAISRYGATISGGPNFAYDLCVRRISAEERATLDLNSWSAAFNGAEPIHQETLERFIKTFQPYGFRRATFYPCYGLAEATLIVSGGQRERDFLTRSIDASALETNRVVQSFPNDEGARILVSCGRSLQQTIIVAPDSLRVCGPDQIGEVWVSGPSVALGYWNRADETEQIFQARLSDSGQGPFLRTGDLGFVKDGELFITGRLKDLIIIRGLNHYPQDIEMTVERCHPALRPGCGAAFSISDDGEERLVVVQEVDKGYQSDLGAVADIIRQAVAEAHNLQTYSIVLIKSGTIPKTTSGKIRRRACRAMFLAGTLESLNESALEVGAGSSNIVSHPKQAVLAAQPAERQALLEAIIQSYVASLLEISASEVRRTDTLSRLGIDSLKSVELSAGLSERFGVTASPIELLQNLKLSDIARRILAEWTQPESSFDVSNVTLIDSASRVPILKAALRESPVPLSFAQQRLWFLDRLVSDSAFYNIPIAIHLAGVLNVEALERSINEIISRHEALRTTFPSVGGQPEQVIAPTLSISLKVEDLAELPAEDKDAAVTALALKEGRGVFELSRGPLIRAMLVRLSNEEHILVVTVHHIISDGWSVGLFLKEMRLLYEAYSKGQASPLKELKIQYADYAVWQREAMKGEGLEKQMEYWKERLKGSLPVLQLPTDRPRPPVQSFRGARHLFTLPEDLMKSLKAFSLSEERTLFMTLTAAFNVLLYRYSGQSDITIGTATHNRSHASLYDLIGFFANTVVLRTQMVAEWSFRQLLSHVRETAFGAYSNQDVPFEKIVEALRINRDPSYAPLFQVMFVLQNEPDMLALDEAFAGLRLSRMHALEDTGTSKRDLTLYVRNIPEGAAALFEYDADLFEEETIARITKHFQTLLKEIANEPNHRLAELSLLDEAEQYQLLTEWNSPEDVHRTPLRAHEMFEERAEQTPDAVAIISRSGKTSYGELNRRANQLARYLKSIGIGPDSLAGICLERSLEMVIAILAILKARGAYMPMDPVYPKDRLNFMLEDSEASVLITTQQLDGIFNKKSARIIFIDADQQDILRQDDSNLKDESLSSSLAYLIYTSGSTGISKGVMITHESLSDYAQAISTAIGISAEDRYLHTASFAFSSSVRQLVVPLCSGAASVIASAEQIADPLALLKLCRDENVTVVDFIPSYWRSCLQALAYLEPSRKHDLLDNKIRLVLSASEPLNSEVPKSWSQKLNHPAKLINMFGQTETTGIASAYKIPDGFDAEGIVSTGRPIAGSRIYILDSDLRPVPIGVPGELHIGGIRISRGYLNSPALTAERFIPDPFGMKPGMRLYKTGDVGYYLPEGNIKFLGRRDHQVKVNGIRIELEEIEKVLTSHPSARDAVVVARQDSAGNNRLAAFVVAEDARDTIIPDLRSYLKQRLPEHMIPSNFVMLKELPLTPNGKLDRSSLPAIDADGANSEIPFAPPGNIIEERVAKIWAEVLGLEQVGVNHNFFELGGHSLSAMLIMSRLRETFKIDLPLRKLFDDPSVAGLALAIGNSEKPFVENNDGGIQPLPRGAGNLDRLIMDLDHFSEEELLSLLEQTNQDK